MAPDHRPRKLDQRVAVRLGHDPERESEHDVDREEDQRQDQLGQQAAGMELEVGEARGGGEQRRAEQRPAVDVERVRAALRAPEEEGGAAREGGDHRQRRAGQADRLDEDDAERRRR